MSHRGPLEGGRLATIRSTAGFWAIWARHHPATEIVEPVDRVR
ncbi:MAG: hypothetical protein GY856_19420 [bacterium]|nr:hypothetical protein [bacterium]